MEHGLFLLEIPQMRSAYHEKQWMVAEDGSLAGVCLGYGDCAEHEFGISPLQVALGIKQHDLMGVESRQVTKLPERGIVFKRETKRVTANRKRHNIHYATLILVIRPWQSNEALEQEADLSKTEFSTHYYCKRLLDGTVDERSTLLTAWDESGFKVTAVGEEPAARLHEIYEALRAKDLCISLRGFGPFGGSGLCLMIASRISDEVRAQVLANDMDSRRLMEKAKSYGLEDKIKAAGLKFFALIPAWADNERTTVRFWLNPWQQDKHNYGWFTPKEILAWTRGEGPVMMNQEPVTQ